MEKSQNAANPSQGDMIDQNGVEAFVKAGEIGAVVSALSMTIGTLVTDSSSDPSLRIYRFQNTSAVLAESEDGFLSVWVRGASGWPTSAALARYLATALNCLVRCEPGPEFPEVSPHSSVFLQIENGRESLVTCG